MSFFSMDWHLQIPSNRSADKSEFQKLQCYGPADGRFYHGNHDTLVPNQLASSSQHISARLHSKINYFNLQNSLSSRHMDTQSVYHNPVPRVYPLVGNKILVSHLILQSQLNSPSRNLDSKHTKAFWWQISLLLMFGNLLYITSSPTYLCSTQGDQQPWKYDELTFTGCINLKIRNVILSTYVSSFPICYKLLQERLSLML